MTSLFNRTVPMNIPLKNNQEGENIEGVVEAILISKPGTTKDDIDILIKGDTLEGEGEVDILVRIDPTTLSYDCEIFLNKNFMCLNPHGVRSRLYAIPRYKVRRYVERKADQEA